MACRAEGTAIGSRLVTLISHARNAANVYFRPMATGGLTSAEATRLLGVHGPNELQREESKNPVLLFLAQLKSPMIILLGVAAVISGALGEVPEAVAIIAIVVLNAVVGFVQEFRAEKAVLALRSLTAPRARVLRDGQAALIAARDVVPGDVLLLESGDLVAADARVLEASVLTTIEATLTGESVPVEKNTTPSAPEAPLAERHDRLYMGTAVATGTGRAVVEGTGAKTELGKIAHLLSTATEQATPLQVQLEKVGRSLVVLCLAVVAVVAMLGVWRGIEPLELFVSCISLAVAAVPEGLPAIVTIALALGVQRMASRNVLVRKLPSVEALGSTTVICTDKTGTLTRGVMTVRELSATDTKELLHVAASCCDAELTDKGGVGDPTEVAILEKAREVGFERAAIEKENPRARVFPFDSIRKRMSVLRGDGMLYVKGAVDLLLPLCTSGTEGALEKNAELSKRGLRVLAVAVRRSVAKENDDPERELTLVGLLGLADPPRPEAITAIAAARSAGIRVVMMTGDHPTTAEAIGREMGLVGPSEPIEGRVYARVTPEDKLRIVRELKAKGEIVAMTGDGTNDAPALKEAHVGIAMGIAGVEVTREAADMVLSDDNFSSIIAAVREGRGIYDNIRRALVYLLGGNAGELLVTLGASLLGLPIPLLALHLLWVNLVTDGLPALALVMEPASDESLKRKPRPPDEPMLGRPEWLRMGAVGVLVGGVALVAFERELDTDTLEHARTMAFSTLVFAQIFNAFAFRSFDRVAFEVGLFANPRLLLVTVLTIALHLGVVALPFTNDLFNLGPFSWKVMGVSMALGLVPATTIEVWKLVRRPFVGRKSNANG
ncbi:MAG: cation-translocating P-type ATPase [Archangium sp.]|nr:cation-translocating P-type ATPase [Archangium sp.]